MRAARARAQAPVTGFSLVELAIVLFIVGLLMLSLMYTLSAQVDQRNFEETRRRLEQARELVLGFALINGRLPCPARANSTGSEVRNVVTGACTDGATEDYYGGTPGGVVGGLLPAATVGFQPVDSQGFAVDAWGNRIRYAVAKNAYTETAPDKVCRRNLASNPPDGDPPLIPHFTHKGNMKENGLDCKPNDLIVCRVNQVIALGAACAAGTAVTNAATVAALMLSTGKNGALGPQGGNELENVNGDHVFVSRTPDPAGSAGGEFDDLLAWIPAGMLYGKLIAAGVLP